MMKTAKLLLHCPDKPGILAEVTDFITVNKGNIIYLDQYVDHVENIFFMRIEWELKNQSAEPWNRRAWYKPSPYVSSRAPA